MDLLPTVVREFILAGSLLIDGRKTIDFRGELFHLDVWDIVVAGQLFGVEGLSTCRWACDENFDWLEPAESVELSL